MAFVPFRHKDTGVIAYYPEHYADDPILSRNIELYDPETEEYEEDKVVEDHIVPVDQRVKKTATPVEDAATDKETK